MSVPKLEESGMHIDKTINLGQIITLVTLLFGIAAAYFNVRYDIELVKRLHEDRITRLEASNKASQGQTERMVDALNSIRTDIAIMRIRLGKIGKTDDDAEGSRNRR